MLKKLTSLTCTLGEGPVWDSKKNKLWWVDIKQKKILALSDINKLEVINCPGQVGCLGILDENHLIVAEETGIYTLNLQTHNFDRLGNISPEQGTVRYNDGKIGPDGRFWFGSLDDSTFPDTGCLYSIDVDGNAKKHLEKIRCSNGIGWTEDGNRMFFTDSMQRMIWSFDFNKTNGNISNKALFAEIRGDQVPDGLAVDLEGNVWSAMWDGWCVVKFDPNGMELERVHVPVPRPTSCAFGGRDMKTLFITSASVDLDQQILADAPDSGELFSIKVDIPGVPVGNFKHLPMAD